MVAAADLKRLIRRTIFATDVESTRYALGGVLVELTPATTITMVGTDGRRLAHGSAPAEAEGGAEAPPGQPVIPVKALKLLERNLDDEDPPVHLAIQSGTAALVRTERAVIYTRLVEGRFPRYQDVFPADAEARIPMEAGPLLSAVEQASIVTSEESRGVDFTFGEGLLEARQPLRRRRPVERRAADQLRRQAGRDHLRPPLPHRRPEDPRARRPPSPPS